MGTYKKITVSSATLAERTKLKAAIGIDGMTSDGKTGLALELAAILAEVQEPDDWKKVYVTDSENRSSLLYLGKRLSQGLIVNKFYINNLNKDTGFSPFNYEYAQRDALEKGCVVNIMDSATHMWIREGGVLDIKSLVEATGGNKYGDSYRAWGHPDMVEAKNLVFSLIRNDKIHIISTLRIKDEIIMEDNPETGKKRIRTVGLKQVTSEGLLYEFDLVLRMIQPGDSSGRPAKVEVSKSRYDIFEKGKVYDMTKELMEDLKEYLKDGTSIEEINEKTKIEMAESLKEKALQNKTMLAIFKNKFPNRKVAELTLSELRELNSDFIEIEYGG